MKNVIAILMMSSLCVLMFVRSTDAMYGLCSTDWYSDTNCFDNNDECSKRGGTCRHDGFGDHGEGCACIKVTRKHGQLRHETLTYDHFKGKGSVLLDYINSNRGAR